MQRKYSVAGRQRGRPAGTALPVPGDGPARFEGVSGAGVVSIVTKDDDPADRKDMNAITLRRSLAASLLALAVGFAALFRS
jgi:hypothetical protein